jgi:phytoene desaturase
LAAKRAVVIGGGLGGLSAAIHLRLGGLEVHLLEANARTGGRANLIELDGFRFDTGPSLLNYPWVFEDLFRAAGRELKDEVDLLSVDPSIKFVWADGETLQLSATLPRLAEEISRMEDGETSGLMAFLADASGKFRLAMEKLAVRNADTLGQWLQGVSVSELARSGVWRSFERELSRFFRNPRLRQALGSYAMYLGGSPHQLPGLFTILPYGELAYGLWLPRGGMYALIQAVENLAASVGVEIRTGCRAERVILREGRAAGVALADGETLEADAVISNVDVPTTRRDLLPPDITPLRRLRMTPSVMTFYIGARGRPVTGGHHTIYLPDDPRSAYDDLMKRGKVPDDLPFYVSVASETDPSLAPEGCSTVFILVPLPLRPHLNGISEDELASSIRQKVRQRLERHGAAALMDGVLVERVWTPQVWERTFGLFQGSAFGAAHTLTQMGPMRCSNRDPSIPGLYYVGASTVPGTGLPMVTIGGRMTAGRVLGDLR